MSPPDFPRYAYVILGMHRSGTSALAGMLFHFGADVSRSQMAPTEDNPRGYFESTAIKVLNDRILASAGTAWDDWSRIPDGWFSGPRARALRQEAQAILTEEFANSPLFVFKDPRNCRLWPFWRDVLTDLGITPIPILMLRNPDEVASSLLRRDKLPLNLGRLIWLRHALDAERWTRGTDRVVTSYAAILTDRSKLLADIERVSHIALPRRSHATEAEVQAFIAPQLRRFCADEPSDPAATADICHEAYRLLQGLGPQAPKSAYARLDAIGQTLEDLSAVIYGLAAPIREVAHDLRRVCAERDALQIAQRDLVAECDVLKALVADKASLLEEAMHDRDALRVAQHDLTDERDALRVAQHDLTEERDALRVAQHDLTEERDALKALVTDKASLLEEAMRTRDATQSELARLAEITARREALLVQKNKEAVIQERQRIQNEFRNSRSWKITAPMRWLHKSG